MYLVTVNENRPEEICTRMREAGLEAKVGQGRGGWEGGWVRGDGRGIVCFGGLIGAKAIGNDDPSREAHFLLTFYFYLSIINLGGSHAQGPERSPVHPQVRSTWDGRGDAKRAWENEMKSKLTINV